MTIVADANIAIAVLDPNHRFHQPALRRCLVEPEVAIVNLTRAEALILPTRENRLTEADDLLDSIGFRSQVLDHRVADRARALRARYGNKNFPLLDAIVVAYGVEHGHVVVTCDAKWPAIEEAEVEVLRLR